MNNTIASNDILMIDNISMEQYNAEVEVGLALCESYIKESMMLIYGNGNQNRVEYLFQEGKVGDFMTDKVNRLNKAVAPKEGESTLKKIVMFIPRLFNKIVQFIYKKIIAAKVKQISKNLEIVDQNADKLLDAFNDDDFNWDDIGYGDESNVDNVNESSILSSNDDYFSEGLGLFNQDTASMNTRARQSSRAAEDALARQREAKKQALIKAGAKQATASNQKVSKADCIKAAKELIVLVDKDQSLFRDFTKIMADFTKVFNEDTLKSPEIIAKYFEDFLMKHQDLIEKSAKNFYDANEKIASKISDRHRIEVDKLSPRQLSKYKEDLESLEEYIDRLYDECVEFTKRIGFDFDSYNSELEKALKEESFKHAVKVGAGIAKDTIKVAMDSQLHYDKYMQTLGAFMNRVGKITDTTLQSIEGGEEYKLTTMQFLKTMLKCLKMIAAVLKKFDTDPETAKLLQISMILMRAVKLVII